MPPSEVSVLNGNISVGYDGILTVTENKVETISCVTRYSNPAPALVWMLGELNVKFSVVSSWIGTCFVR